MRSLTLDTFFYGRIQVKQHKEGYRFSIDAVLLAHHAAARPGDKVLDLGTGCGIIPMILAYRYPKIRVYGVELQPELAEIATLNVNENHIEDRIVILCRDMRELNHHMVSGPADLVISNPPYRPAKSGRINSNHQQAIARHEIKVTLTEVVETARRMLRTCGRFVTIYPAERMTDILTQMRRAGIEPKFLRMIHSEGNLEAKRILVEGIKEGGPGIKIGPPLIIYHRNGSYTEEVEKMFLP